jgi:hypothetical protein
LEYDIINTTKGKKVIIMMYRLSRHAQVERQDRLFAIIDTIGIGKEVDKFYNAERDNYEVFTDTGVMLVVDDKNTLITAYAVDLNRARAVYCNHGRSHISPRVADKILRNEAHYKFLFNL